MKEKLDYITTAKQRPKTKKKRLLENPDLRRWYDNIARGKIAHDFRVFFMGHKGSIESKYTTNKGVLPDTLIEEMRQAFRRSEEFLDLELQKNNLTKKEANTSETTHLQPTQMVVAIDQAESLISQGWRFVGTLPKDKAVVEKNGFGL